MTVRSALRAPVRAAVRAPIILRKRWTPAALFAQGRQGVWYEPKPQYLFQDAAGTVPVTSDGDPVGYMQDLSGNGNHATQSMSAARPVFPGLVYDGVDDHMGVVVSFSQSTSFSVLSVSTIESEGVSWVANIGDSPSAETTFVYLRPDGSSSSGLRVGGGFKVSHVFAAGTNQKVLTEIHCHPDKVEFWMNGALVYEEVVAVPEFSLSGRLRLGLNISSNEPWNGEIGSFVFRNSVLSDEQKVSARNYLAKREGITL